MAKLILKGEMRWLTFPFNPILLQKKVRLHEQGVKNTQQSH